MFIFTANMCIYVYANAGVADNVALFVAGQQSTTATAPVCVVRLTGNYTFVDILCIIVGGFFCLYPATLASMEKFPFSLVKVPVFVPFISTLTPVRGLPDWSVTCPFTYTSILTSDLELKQGKNA